MALHLDVGGEGGFLCFFFSFFFFSLMEHILRS